MMVLPTLLRDSPDESTQYSDLRNGAIQVRIYFVFLFYSNLFCSADNFFFFVVAAFLRTFLQLHHGFNCWPNWDWRILSVPVRIHYIIMGIILFLFVVAICSALLILFSSSLLLPFFVRIYSFTTEGFDASLMRRFLAPLPYRRRAWSSCPQMWHVNVPRCFLHLQDVDVDFLLL